MFPARRLLASPAYIGPNGGWAGGVAILVPHNYTVLHVSTLVAGCALAAALQSEHHTFRFISVYLPPDRRQDVLSELAVALDGDDETPSFWGGDINME